jgi:hypothetical protein
VFNSNVTPKPVIKILVPYFIPNFDGHPKLLIQPKGPKIKLISKYRNGKELTQIITSNFYSFLQFRSLVYKSLYQNIKHSLFVTSARALKVVHPFDNDNITYVKLYKATERASPDMYSNYKLALLLYTSFNGQLPNNEWVHMNFQQTTLSRQTALKTITQKLALMQL